MGSDPPWRGLEPSALLINLLPDLWRTLRGLWWVIPAMWASGNLQSALDLGFLLLFFALSVARTLSHFLTLRYRTREGRLEITQGLLSRSHRTIDPARVQHVEITQNLLHRAAKLVELRIDTAGEAGIEGQLSGLTEAEARRLHAFLSRAGAGSPAGSPPGSLPGSGSAEGPPDLQNSALELIAYGLSVGRVGAALVAGTILMEYLAVLSPRMFGGTLARLSATGMAGFLLVGTVASFALSAGSALVRYYGLTLRRTRRGLRVESGLFTRTGVEIPRDKVQIVRVSQPLSRRLLGFGTVRVETAGAVLPGEDRAAAEAYLPMVEAHALAWACRIALPALDADPWAAPLLPAAPRALPLALLRATPRWLGLAGLLCWQLDAAWPLWLLLPGWLLAARAWRAQGWLLTPRAAIVRTGFLSQNTLIIERDKIQSVRYHQSWLMRLFGTGRVTLRVAGSALTLPELEEGKCEEIFRDLVAR